MTTPAVLRAFGTCLAAFARRHQLLTFFALAFAFSWWAWFWYRLDPGHVDAPILPLGPFLAALVMLSLIGGRPAIREWFRKIVHWRVRPVWYAIALLVPPGLTFAAVAINVATGAMPIPVRVVPGLGAVAAQFAFVLVWIGIGEEPACVVHPLRRGLSRPPFRSLFAGQLGSEGGIRGVSGVDATALCGAGRTRVRKK